MVVESNIRALNNQSSPAVDYSAIVPKYPTVRRHVAPNIMSSRFRRKFMDNAYAQHYDELRTMQGALIDMHSRLVKITKEINSGY